MSIILNTKVNKYRLSVKVQDDMLIEVNTGNDEINRIIAYCIGYPTVEKVRAKLEEYFSKENLKLYSTADFSGIIGIELNDKGSIEIKHIAVDPNKRNQSLGRRMIDKIVKITHCSVVYAETDDRAAGFYRKCGFSVKSLGEKYHGVIRYYCDKNI